MPMKKILVSGLVNIETSVSVDHFPIDYAPIEYPLFGVDSNVSGVGFNVAKALKMLGDDVDLLSEVGDDMNGRIVREEIKRLGIDPSHCLIYKGRKTSESVVLVDKQGRRKIYCDLKDIQDRAPLEETAIPLEDYSSAVLTNINFNRSLLKIAKGKGIEIATDVHVLSSLDDPYNQDFLTYADILFLSNEGILDHEADFIRGLHQRFHNPIIVCGCGDQGALLYLGDEDRFVHAPAVAPFGIVSTVGAGDALFSAFIHYHVKGLDPESCLRKAVLFAGIKIAHTGGSNGFSTEQQIEEFER